MVLTKRVLSAIDKFLVHLLGEGRGRVKGEAEGIGRDIIDMESDAFISSMSLNRHL